MAKKKNKFIRWLNNKLQIVIYKADNYREIIKFKLNGIKIIIIISCLAGFFFMLSTLLYFYTPLKHTVPGYPSKASENIVYENYIKIDSILIKLEQKDQYLTVIRDFLFNNVPIDKNFEIPIAELTPEFIEEFNNPTKTPHIIYTSKPRKVEKEIDSLQLQLFPPLRDGIIQANYSTALKHYGIDLASNNQTVYACLDGTVISSNYTIETGYVIIIQHKYNLISVYKHNEISYVETGGFVEAGQAISKYGNCGEYSNGPHVHFELWRNGISINPEDYIQF